MKYYVYGMYASNPPYYDIDKKIILIGPVEHEELLSIIDVIMATDKVEWIEIEWRKENDLPI